MKNYEVDYYYSELYCIHGSKKSVIIPYNHMPSYEDTLDYMEENDIESCRKAVEIESIREV